MSAPNKLLHVLAFLAKAESTYGSAVALTTTADGVQLQYKDRNQGAPVTLKYAFDGQIGPSVGGLGQVLAVAPSGRSMEGTLPMRARAAGTAYSASIVPNVHTMLKSAGFDATVTTTGGSEKWVYTPTAAGTGYSSITGNMYARGELWALAGGLSSLKIDATDAAPPMWNFDLKGIATALPTDGAAPTVTYPLQAQQPPLASSVSLTLGTFTTNAVLYSANFDMARVLDPRVALTASGAHLGFVPGDRKPTLKLVLEATSLVTTPFTSSAGFDGYSLRDQATSLAAAIQFGTTQYNRYKINFGQCQVIDAQPGNQGGIATMELTLGAYNSTATSADDISITFD